MMKKCGFTDTRHVTFKMKDWYQRAPQYTVPTLPRGPQGGHSAILARPQWSPVSIQKQCQHDAASNSHPMSGVPASMLKVTEMAVKVTPEASLKRLVHLVDYLTKWNISQ